MAHRAHIPLWIAGGNRPFSLRFQAFFSGDQWFGEVGGITKQNLFASAKGLLFPILWEEPFGLVVLEALASGTPVFAHPRGAMKEILTSKGGFLFQTDEEFLENVVKSFDPYECRQIVEEKFTHYHMAIRHEDIYRHHLGRIYDRTI